MIDSCVWQVKVGGVRKSSVVLRKRKSSGRHTTCCCVSLINKSTGTVGHAGVGLRSPEVTQLASLKGEAKTLRCPRDSTAMGMGRVAGKQLLHRCALGVDAPIAFSSFALKSSLGIL